jgi:hypothetical protein
MGVGHGLRVGGHRRLLQDLCRVVVLRYLREPGRFAEYLPAEAEEAEGDILVDPLLELPGGFREHPFLILLPLLLRPRLNPCGHIPVVRRPVLEADIDVEAAVKQTRHTHTRCL